MPHDNPNDMPVSEVTTCPDCGGTGDDHTNAACVLGPIYDRITNEHPVVENPAEYVCPRCMHAMRLLQPDPRSTTRFHPHHRCTNPKCRHVIEETS